MSYDGRCEELANYFLEDSTAPGAEAAALAQVIQDAIEDWLNERATNQAEALADRSFDSHLEL